MTKCFEENFKQACNESCYFDFMNNIDNPEYKELSNKSNTIFNEIKEKLGDDHKLLHRLEEVNNQLGGLEDDFLYHQGFKDCVFLLKWIGAL